MTHNAYTCAPCGNFFHEPHITEDREKSEFWGEPVINVTRTEMCPACGSEDITEVASCADCGEEIFDEFDGCVDCEYKVLQKWKSELELLRATIQHSYDYPIVYGLDEFKRVLGKIRKVLLAIGSLGLVFFVLCWTGLLLGNTDVESLIPATVLTVLCIFAALFLWELEDYLNGKERS